MVRQCHHSPAELLVGTHGHAGLPAPSRCPGDRLLLTVCLWQSTHENPLLPIAITTGVTISQSSYRQKMTAMGAGRQLQLTWGNQCFKKLKQQILALVVRLIFSPGELLTNQQQEEALTLSPPPDQRPAQTGSSRQGAQTHLCLCAKKSHSWENIFFSAAGRLQHPHVSLCFTCFKGHRCAFHHSSNTIPSGSFCADFTISK